MQTPTAPQACTDDDLHALVAQTLEQDPHFMPQMLAARLGLPVERIVAALPEDMRLRLPGEAWKEVWEAMTAWELVTFMASTPGAILEIPCRLPKGVTAHGMYNLTDKSSPLRGHLLQDAIASVWFVSKPVFGLESHSVQFYDAEGNQCFGVYLGRNERREIIPAVRDAYFALRRHYAADLNAAQGATT